MMVPFFGAHHFLLGHFNRAVVAPSTESPSGISCEDQIWLNNRNFDLLACQGCTKLQYNRHLFPCKWECPKIMMPAWIMVTTSQIKCTEGWALWKTSCELWYYPTHVCKSFDNFLIWKFWFVLCRQLILLFLLLSTTQRMSVTLSNNSRPSSLSPYYSPPPIPYISPSFKNIIWVSLRKKCNCPILQ